MGVYQALYAIGMLTGPLLSGVVADGLGVGSVFYLSGATVLLAGGLALMRTVPSR
jgi:predicted MFS family arabinose efflux permease